MQIVSDLCLHTDYNRFLFHLFYIIFIGDFSLWRILILSSRNECQKLNIKKVKKKKKIKKKNMLRQFLWGHTNQYLYVDYFIIYEYLMLSRPNLNIFLFFFVPFLPLSKCGLRFTDMCKYFNEFAHNSKRNAIFIVSGSIFDCICPHNSNSIPAIV